MQMLDPPDATLTQAVLLVEDSARVLTPLAGKPVLTWKMRELQRFGVEDFIVLGMPEDAAQDDLDHASFGLPKPPKLRFGPRGRWDAVLPYLQPRFLLISAERRFEAAGFGAASGRFGARSGSCPTETMVASRVSALRSK